MQLVVLDEHNPQFPDPNTALDEPDGLLAAGGNLKTDTLLSAYYHGIFPWYSEGDPILWWSPQTRCVIEPGALHISKSLKKSLRQQAFKVTFNHSFQNVIEACSRKDTQEGSWINQEIMDAYNELHIQGHAHSIEVWRNQELIGGAYGVAMGAIFCGESMFSYATNSSKIALVYLCKQLIKMDFKLLDCQIETDHLLRMGAQLLPRSEFLALLQSHREQKILWHNQHATSLNL
jgi:leucyl/phenylalanyl-tRNA--protein transferase